MDTLLVRAILFATKSHAGQFRKYKDALGLTEQYITHPARVAAGVAQCHAKLGPDIFEAAMSAAWCHDVIEDCGVPLDALVNATSYECGRIVHELTNQSKYKPELNRAERKRLDREHIKTVSYEARIIKFIDRIDNVKGMVYAPSDFALKYLDESEQLAEALRSTDRDMFNVLAMTINSVRRYVNSHR